MWLSVISLYIVRHFKKLQFPDVYYLYVCVQNLKETLVLMYLKLFSTWWSYMLYLRFFMDKM